MVFKILPDLCAGHIAILNNVNALDLEGQFVLLKFSEARILITTFEFEANILLTIFVDESTRLLRRSAHLLYRSLVEQPSLFVWHSV